MLLCSHSVATRQHRARGGTAIPLQNRVDPFGAVHAVAARGLFTGNRGIIHDPVSKTLLRRRWSTRAWIICECAFRGRRREVMGRNGRNGGAGWTELFFLDEVTALAAGHRPCFHCRRERAADFARCFAGGKGAPKLSAPSMDARLHRERRASGRPAPALPAADIDGLPDGTMVEHACQAFALCGGSLLPWAFSGYGEPLPAAALPGTLHLVTPQSTVAALRNGYRPAWHGTARP